MYPGLLICQAKRLLDTYKQKKIMTHGANEAALEIRTFLESCR
jgi:hypothetical protein